MLAARALAQNDRIQILSKLSIREKLITQCNYIINYTGKLGICRGLSVTGKGQHVGLGPIGLHSGKGGAQGVVDFLSGGSVMMRMVLAVTAALAVDAVKGAYLTVGGHQVNTQRYTQATAVNGSEYR